MAKPGKELVMCNPITYQVEASGSGKGAQGWFPLTVAQVYHDHPFHLSLEDALIIDFRNEAMGPSARVAVELSPDSGRALVRLIGEAAVGEGLLCNPMGFNAGISGSGKGPRGWFALRDAQVCYAAPTSAPFEEALLIDFRNDEQGPAARVAVELSPESGRELARAIEEALATAHSH